MTKSEINQICDKLTQFADNCAEQERIIRGIVAVLRSSKEDKTITNKPDDNTWADRIERLLKEAEERSKQQNIWKYPFDTHPYPPYINNTPCDPVYPGNVGPITCDGSIGKTPISQPVVYANSNGIHIKETDDSGRTIEVTSNGKKSQYHVKW